MAFKISHYDALTKDELYNILYLRNEVFIVEQKCPYQDCDGRDLDAYHLQYFDSDKLVGYLRILKPGVSYPEISIGRVLTKETHRHLKLGRLIMSESLQFIKEELAHCEIRISAQAYLEKFYQSLGFERSSENYLEDDIPHLEMFYNDCQM